jgi:TonB-linked SusC/RagA family outer membrane protein
MKHKLLSLFGCLLLGVASMFAQTTRVSGTVISGEDNLPIIGASVKVPGSTDVGTITDVDGNFTLVVPAGTASLEFSYIGMLAQTVAVAPNMRVVLHPHTEVLDEIVVTALGLSKDAKSLGYAASTIKSEELSAAQSGSVMGSLTGKVAGVTVTGAGSTGAAQNVLIRGISSLTGSNQPLYIVDGVPIINVRNNGAGTATNTNSDFGNSANDLNPDNVESVTVLKGASATALYGSRAANGVIMITTKKASEKRVTLEYNGAFTASNILRVMKTQDLFGQGWGSWDRAENGSWGSRLDGVVREWGSDQLTTPMQKPYSYIKDNLKDFYKTGLEMINGISVSYGDSESGIMASFNNVSSNGILPNNGDTYYKNNFFLKGYANVGKFSINASMEYNRKDISRSTSMNMELLQHAVDVSFTQMKDYNDERYNTDNYYTYYAHNPYWMIDNFRYDYQDDKITARAELGYQIIPGLKAVGRLGGDFLNSRSNERQPILSYTPGSYNDVGGASPELGYYSEFAESRSQIDATALLSADYRFGDFALDATAGWNLNVQTRNLTGGVVDGLTVPGWYNLANTTSAAVVDTYKERRRLIGAFGAAGLSYRDMVYLNLSARNDWSSTLPINDNSFFYGGVNASVLLTEMFPALKENYVDYLKVRGAIGQTGNDASVFRTASWFSLGEFSYTYLPIGGNPGLTENNRMPNTDLKPEISTEYEVGVQGNFFDNRVSIDAAFYDKRTKNQIISANLAPETGYSTSTKNIGEIMNRGIELMVEVVPVRTRDWEWSVGWTFAKNQSEVLELWSENGEEVTEFALGYWSSYRGVEFMAIKGEPVGVYRIPAVDKVKEGKYAGYTIVTNNGFISQSADEKEILGSAQPDFTMGFTTNLKYKDFSLSLTGDWRKGGWMYSETSYITHFNGNSTETLFNERNSFVVPHSVKKIGDEYVENNIPIAVPNMPYALGQDGYNPNVRKNFVLPRDYFKLREVVLAYKVPSSLLSKTPFSAVSVKLIGRNLLLFTPKRNNYIDPEVTTLGNDLSSMLGETQGTDSTRNFGIGLNVKF